MRNIWDKNEEIEKFFFTREDAKSPENCVGYIIDPHRCAGIADASDAGLMAGPYRPGNPGIEDIARTKAHLFAPP